METQFLALEEQWMAAWRDKDVQTVRAILSDDFSLTSSLSTGGLMNKEEWIDKAMSQYHCKEFKFNNIKVRVYQNTAIVNSWFWQEANVNGKSWNGDFLITDVWVKQNEQWQVAARHATWLQQ